MTQEREKVTNFNGKAVCDHITQKENDKVVAEAWLTTPSKYNDTKEKLGASNIGVTENGRFAFMDKEGVELESYRLSKDLQGLEPQELIEKKHALLFFQSWFPKENRWVNNVAMASQKPKCKATAEA